MTTHLELLRTIVTHTVHERPRGRRAGAVDLFQPAIILRGNSLLLASSVDRGKRRKPDARLRMVRLAEDAEEQPIFESPHRQGRTESSVKKPSSCQRFSPIRCRQLLALTKIGTPRAAKSSLNLISGRLRRPRQNPSFRGGGVSTTTGPIYFGGRPRPRHGFSRSLPILVMRECDPRASMPSTLPRQGQGRFRDIAIGRR